MCAESVPFPSAQFPSCTSEPWPLVFFFRTLQCGWKVSRALCPCAPHLHRSVCSSRAHFEGHCVSRTRPTASVLSDFVSAAFTTRCFRLLSVGLSDLVPSCGEGWKGKHQPSTNSFSNSAPFVRPLTSLPPLSALPRTFRLAGQLETSVGCSTAPTSCRVL